MNKSTVLSTFIILFALLIGFPANSQAKSNNKKALKSFESDFVKVNDTLYVNKYEVTNARYKKFINHLEESKNNDLYEMCKYDSAQWAIKVPLGDKAIREGYYYHSYYNNHPIINVSLEAANHYCKWLTDKYNSYENRRFKQVIFRLPTEQEWMTISSPLPGHGLPWFGNAPYDPESLKSKSNMTSLANVKIFDKVSGRNVYGFDGAIYTQTVGTYRENSLGVYDMIGNVCEMTSDGNIKGGSYDNYIEECYIDLTQDFSAPDPRVGFRIVMVVIEN